jgi:hydrogenase maturation factor
MRSPSKRLLPYGKIPHDLLKKILSGMKSSDPTVKIGPAVGIDASIISPQSKMLAVTSDPITLTGNLAAYYAVHVSANDLAVMGATPKYMTVVGLFPRTSADAIETLAKDLVKYSGQLGIDIIGGHTEITSAVTAPVLITTMLGPVKLQKPISPAGVKDRDFILMTKTAGLEAAAIIAREKENVLLKNGFNRSSIRSMQNLLFSPGISILPEAEIAVRYGCSAMHDATEGGVLTALWEMAEASKISIYTDTRHIPVLSQTRQACAIWKIDPLKVISSGSLIVAMKEKKIKSFANVLEKKNIPLTIVGVARKDSPGLFDMSSKKMILPCEDQISKIFSFCSKPAKRK